jgi:hypothetical protein
MKTCPQCHLMLETVESGGQMAWACRSCGGCWLKAGRDKDVTAVLGPLSETLARDFSGLASAGMFEGLPRYCPDCRTNLLQPTEITPPAEVRPLACAACGGVWMEADERDRLSNVLTVAPAKGTTPVPEPEEPSPITPAPPMPSEEMPAAVSSGAASMPAGSSYAPLAITDAASTVATRALGEGSRAVSPPVEASSPVPDPHQLRPASPEDVGRTEEATLPVISVAEEVPEVTEDEALEEAALPVVDPDTAEVLEELVDTGDWCCPRCLTIYEVEEGAEDESCDDCGVLLVQADGTIACPDCGAENRFANGRCIGCGEELRTPERLEQLYPSAPWVGRTGARAEPAPLVQPPSGEQVQQRTTVITQRRRWCPLCRVGLPASSTICAACGVGSVEGSYRVRCLNCGRECDIGTEMCWNCDAAIHPEPTSSYPRDVGRGADRASSAPPAIPQKTGTGSCSGAIVIVVAVLIAGATIVSSL